MNISDMLNNEYFFLGGGGGGVWVDIEVVQILQAEREVKKEGKLTRKHDRVIHLSMNKTYIILSPTEALWFLSLHLVEKWKSFFTM